MVGMIEFTVDASQVEEFLETRGELIVKALRAELTGEMVNLLSYVKDDKLSGQVLSQRSGNLKNSGFSEVTETADTMLGTVAFGATVPYARIHEYGGPIDIPEVADKLMVFERNGEAIFTRRHRAFTVQMPARPYLGPSLEEKTPEIMGGLQGAVNEAIAG